jgi:hypothetical protein
MDGIGMGNGKMRMVAAAQTTESSGMVRGVDSGRQGGADSGGGGGVGRCRWW